MILAVVSDTHDNLHAIRKMLEAFRRCQPDLVIHLGDIISPFSLREMLAFPTRYVFVLGNNDGDRSLLREIAMKAGAVMRDHVHELNVDNLKLLAMHGFGSAELTKSLVDSLALSGRYNVVLYGHTHQIDVRRVGGTLIVNPGECCGYLTGRCTFALLNTRTLDVEIVHL